MAGLPGDFWVNDLYPPIIPTGFDSTNWDRMFLGPIPKAWPGIVKIEASVSLSTEVVHYTDPVTVNLPLISQVQKIFFVDKGYEPAKIRATLMLWDRFQWLSLRAFMASVAPDVTASIRPYYTLRHPAASLLGISSVIVDGFTVHPPEDQTLFIDINMTQGFEYDLRAKKAPLDGGAASAIAAVLPDAGSNIG